MLYAKLLTDYKHFFCLRSNWTEFMQLSNDKCPEGYVPFIYENEKPELEDDQVMAYECTVDQEGLHRKYMAISVEESKNRMYYPPRTFSKLKCIEALMKEGVWSEVKKWIEDSGLYDLYLAAQDFKEDNEYFVIGKTQLQQKLGWDDQKIGNVLEKCVSN